MTRPTVLITGGTGFVGSHTGKAQAKAGYLPLAYDDLSDDVKDAVHWGPLEVEALEDEADRAPFVVRHKPLGVPHFAAFIKAGESVREPERFYQNNVAGTLILFLEMHGASVDRLVSLSTTVVYGNPEITSIIESYPLRSVNPYCSSKLMPAAYQRRRFSS